MTTENKDRKVNAAPYSFVAPLSFEPPLVMLGVGQGKQTAKNIMETKEFVLNMVSGDWAHRAVACEEKLEDWSQRIEKAGLHMKQSQVVSVPCIMEAKATLECRLHETVQVKDSDHVLIVGRIVGASCGSLASGAPDLDELDYLMHAFGGEFRRVGSKVELQRKK